MITLPNGCWCSDLKVHPKNWNSSGASTRQDWYIQYYFHDPNFKKIGKYKYGKYCIVKGMNKLKSLAERRAITKILIEDELKLLKEEGYNPITGTKSTPIEVEYEIDPNTKFSEALELAYKKIKADKNTLADIKSILKYFKQSVKTLTYDIIPISQIKRKHIRFAIDNCSKVKAYWSPNQFNHYRRYLSMLFSTLVEFEAIDVNPVLGIAKEKTVKNLRVLLTTEQRECINAHFGKIDPPYQRFLHIFFHSGARPKELLSIKKENVNLQDQTFKILIKKGKYHREELRPIKNIALSYWEDIYNEALPGQYLFSKDLKPGTKPTTRDYITKKWQREVKKHLKIDADLYSLKHLNLDETAAELDIRAAAKMAGHTSTVITMKHYAIREKERQDNLLKEVKNKFA